MNSLAIPSSMPGTSKRMVRKIEHFENEYQRKLPQISFTTEHVFHAGVYARTVRIPSGVLFTNVLVKCPTLVIVHGEIAVSLDENSWIESKGYQVCAAEAGRKQIYMTLTEVEMTMIFATEARTVEEAEAEFTDETENLLSHSNENAIVSTTCLESLPEPRS